jgi:oligopeptide/dipeptide ABC transporter ATP-binding protein
MADDVMLAVTDLRVNFGLVHAVDGASLAVAKRPFGIWLVGESGSGKTTVGRAILRLAPAAGGTILFEGQDVLRLRGLQLREYRRAAQIVFQDADNSLDPPMRVGTAIGEVLITHGLTRSAVSDQVAALLTEVGLEPALASRHPHQLSGGQRQRAAVARALAVAPRLLITHNLAIVTELCDQTTMLYLGRVAESGPTASLLAVPAHTYTLALRSAIPEIDPARRRSRIILPGGMVNTAARPLGCAFHPRCPLAVDLCRVSVPELRTVAPGRQAACHRANEVLGGLRPSGTVAQLSIETA